MNCIIVDDEVSAINILKRYVADVPSLKLIGTFQNSIEGLQFVNNNHVDLIYLDINMPNLNGISFLELLQNKSKVILTTAYSEYAIEGYKFDVIDYLLKPISFEKFLKASLKALGTESKQEALQATNNQPIEDYIMVQTENKGKYKKVNYNDINYAEAMLNYAAIVTLDNEKVILHISMKELIERLPSHLFIRIHKSYIVALKQIKYIEAAEVVLLNDAQRLPLGVTFKENLFKILDNRLLS
jgi:two-component system, LytTR family, response regulator